MTVKSEKGIDSYARIPVLTDYLRMVELGLAYEWAAHMIEAECVAHTHDDDLENGWYDLDSSDEELEDEVMYLDARRLISRHPEHPNWVTIHEEGEPLPAVAP